MNPEVACQQGSSSHVKAKSRRSRPLSSLRRHSTKGYDLTGGILIAENVGLRCSLLEGGIRCLRREYIPKDCAWIRVADLIELN